MKPEYYELIFKYGLAVCEAIIDSYKPKPKITFFSKLKRLYKRIFGKPEPTPKEFDFDNTPPRLAYSWKDEAESMKISILQSNLDRQIRHGDYER